MAICEQCQHQDAYCLSQAHQGSTEGLWPTVTRLPGHLTVVEQPLPPHLLSTTPGIVTVVFTLLVCCTLVLFTRHVKHSSYLHCYLCAVHLLCVLCECFSFVLHYTPVMQHTFVRVVSKILSLYNQYVQSVLCCVHVLLVLLLPAVVVLVAFQCCSCGSMYSRFVLVLFMLLCTVSLMAPVEQQSEDEPCQTQVTRLIGLDMKMVVVVAFSAFIIGVVLMATVWLIHTRTGEHCADSNHLVSL